MNPSRQVYAAIDGGVGSTAYGTVNADFTEIAWTWPDNCPSKRVREPAMPCKLAGI